MDEMDDGLISFKWNNHKNTFFHVLSTLRCKETYTDATLACEGKFFPVHKLVMSTCSDYFGEVFEKAACKAPVVILKDIRQQDLEALLDYMYLGEVDVKQSELSELLKAAECLRIKGLAVPDYLSFGTSPKNSVGAHHANDLGQNIHEESDSAPYYQDESDSSPPTKRPKKNDEQQSNSIEYSDYLNKPHLPNFSSQHLQVLTTPPPLPVFISSTKHSQRQHASTVAKLTSTPTKPTRPNYQRKRISVRTPQSSKFAQALKIVKKPKKRMMLRKNMTKTEGPSSHKNMTKTEGPSSHKNMTKTEGPSSHKNMTKTEGPSSHNHRDYYFIHKEREGSEQRVNSEHGTVPEEGSSASSKSVPQRRKKHTSVELTSSDLRAERVRPSLLLSASLANLKEKQEPIIAPEEFCDRIGLPQFSSALLPILEGQELSANERHKLANKVIEELISHFKANHVFAFMCSRTLRSKFYRAIQVKIVEKYPNNALEEDSQRKGRKGPLGITIGKVAERMNRRMRLQRNKQQRIAASTPKNLSSSASQPSNSELNVEVKEEQSQDERNVEKERGGGEKKPGKQVEEIKKNSENEQVKEEKNREQTEEGTKSEVKRDLEEQN